MSLTTGHTLRQNFVAGQLKDGDSLGLFYVPAGIYDNNGSTLGPAVNFDVRVRYYQGKLVAVVGILSGDGTTIKTNYSVKEAGYLINVSQYYTPQNPTLKNIAAQCATLAVLKTIGLDNNYNVPTQPTGQGIPFQQDADGLISPYVSNADLVNKLNDLDKKTVATTETGSTDTSKKLSTPMKIAIGVGIAAVVGLIIYMVSKK